MYNVYLCVTVCINEFYDDDDDNGKLASQFFPRLIGNKPDHVNSWLTFETSQQASYHCDDFVQRQPDFKVQNLSVVVCSRNSENIFVVCTLQQMTKEIIFGRARHHHCTKRTQRLVTYHINHSSWSFTHLYSSYMSSFCQQSTWKFYLQTQHTDDIPFTSVSGKSDITDAGSAARAEETKNVFLKNLPRKPNLTSYVFAQTIRIVATPCEFACTVCIPTT